MTKARQHPRVSTIISAVAALATVLALSACAPAAPHPGSTTHAHAGSGHGSGSVPKPTPTPLAAPVTRVTQTCSQLVSASALATSVGVNVPVVTPPADPASDITFTQAGALTCNWSDNYPGDAQQTSNHLVLWVLPDVSTADWTTASSTITEIGETKTSIISGDAYGWCNPAIPTGTVCEVDTRVGTTWVSLEIESVSKAFATSDLGLSHFAALLNPVIAAAGNASFVKEPKWTNLAATTTPTTCATTISDSEIDSVAGVSGVDSIGPDLSDQESLAEYWGAAAGLGEVECDLASADQQNGFFSSVVPGGSWAWSFTVAQDSSQPGYATVPSLGSQAVEYTNSNSGGTSIDWVRGGNLCNLNVALANPAKQAAVAVALATYMNGEISG
ncbi:MAG TPA: hypothetical protein VHZ98_10460 [Galbitalea sp.]|nr:hypothetical protein [Galbitalea sp.]